MTISFIMGQDSSVVIVTGYRPDVPGNESRWVGGARYPTPVQTGHEAHQASYTMVLGLSHGYSG
jgi:hypothetical protein